MQYLINLFSDIQRALFSLYENKIYSHRIPTA